MRGRQCFPEFWSHFNYEKTSRSSPLRELPMRAFVSLAIPAGNTNRDAVEQVAAAARIPIESLADDLDRPTFLRGPAFFSFAGDIFDEIASDYNHMDWWISDVGLNMEVIVPSTPERPLTLDEHMARRFLAPSPHSGCGSGRPHHRKGRRANHGRREAIATALKQHGDNWRENLSEVLEELNNAGVSLGDFAGMSIDVCGVRPLRVSSWLDLDMAEGNDRRKIIDALRKYRS